MVFTKQFLETINAVPETSIATSIRGDGIIAIIINC